MTDTASSSSLISSTSLSSSLSTSASISTSSLTSSTILGIPTSTTSSNLLSTGTTTTTTELTDSTTLTSTTDTNPSLTTASTTSITSTTFITPTTTSLSTRTTVTAGAPATVLTTTSVVTVVPSTQIPSRTAARDSSNGFFENKGAVAGVFTVVGLIVSALLVILIVTIIRRRRAKQFDREVEAAAAEAAAAPPPRFLDDDDDDDPYRQPVDQPIPYIDHPQYSDISSHGTYSQPPLASQEAYGMRNLGPSPGELYNNNPYATGGTAGAAGVGVARARSTRDPGAFASGFQDGATPYPAFAGPAAFNSGAYGNGGGHDSSRGVGVGVGAVMQRGMSLNHHSNVDYTSSDQEHQYLQGVHPGQYVQQSDLVRNPSQMTYNTTRASPTLGSSSASPPLPYAENHASAPIQEAGEDAYEGFTDDLQGAGRNQEDRQSYAGDDEDEGRPKILKVANR